MDALYANCSRENSQGVIVNPSGGIDMQIRLTESQYKHLKSLARRRSFTIPQIIKILVVERLALARDIKDRPFKD